MGEKVKRQSRGTGKFFLGWFVGFIFTLVLIAGFGYWFYKCGTIGGLEKTFKFEISALDKDAKNMTIENLLGKVVKVASNYNDMSLEEISDTVGLNLESTLTVTQTESGKTYKYKTIDVTIVVKGKIGDISTNFQKVVDDMTLADIEESFNVTLPNIELINSVKTAKIKELGTAMSDAFKTYTLNKISADFDVSFNDVDMLKNLLDTPIQDLGDEINNLTVADVFDVTKPGTSKILISIKDSKIKDLSETIKTLTLNDILDVTGNSLLQALQDSTIDSLNNDISNLTLGEVFTIDSNSSKFLQALQNKKILEIDTAMDSLKISDVIDVAKEVNPDYNSATDPSYKQYKKQGVWAYINTDGLLKDLSTQIDDLSFSDKTLGELQYQGLISETANLNKKLSNSTSDKLLSDYTLDEILDEITK